MKKLKLLSFGLLAGGMLLTADPAQAQFNMAANPDNLMTDPDPGVSHIYYVENTGNDVGEYQGREFKVMTWDGKYPAFGWDLSQGSLVGSEFISMINKGTVSDPDIVVDTDGKGKIAITYVLDQGQGPEIWAEVWEFNGSGVNLAMGPYQIDDKSGAPCSSPNIDIDYKNGDAVITWEQNGEIYAQVFNIYSGPSGNIFEVSRPCYGGDNKQPDVATYFDPNTGNTVVSFTYVHKGGELILQQEDLNDVMNNPSSGCGITYLVKTVPYGSKYKDELFKPRIAAPHQNISSDPYDVTIAVHHYTTSYNLIYSFNMYAGTHGFGNLHEEKLNNDHGIWDCGNYEPALSYVGKDIIVAWTFDDSYCGILNGDRDVIVRQLSYDGYLLYPDYSVVNIDLTKNQFAPSVAGRRDLNEETFFTFYDDNKEYIWYKSSHYTNQNLRKGNTDAAATNSQLNVYPMPVSGEATIAYSIGTGETGVTLELYNLTGQRMRTYNISGQGEGNHTLTLGRSSGNLASGVYLLRMNTNLSSKAIRVVVE